jgi:dynein heavy chain
MVEKWLIQVEDNMISSIRRKISESIAAYTSTPRDRWVIDWPGQVVLCVSSIFWTNEVSEAMTKEGGIQVSYQ